jgi:outer membrane protein OmpA-like peptidoglycan-associated protein
VAEQKDGLWGIPKKLDLPRLHKDGFFYNAHVSEDESVIIVSMKRRKQPYDEDLFVTYRQADGSWSDFTNLGPAINTEGFEITPFLSADKRKLYFASNGHGGLGDADIWMSERQGNGWTQWSKARNLGKPINSAGFDAAFRLYADSSIFFASNRAGGLSNLYESRILSPDDTLDQEEAVPLVFQQKSEAERQAMRPSPEDNSLLASRSGEAIVVEDVYPLSLSIYFAFDSDELSEAARQKLRELFQKYTAGDVRVELTGHTDAVGTQDYNQRLSFRRAYAAQQFLQSAGLAQEQLRADGRGEAEPVASNETEDGRRQNRRVSIRVVR